MTPFKDPLADLIASTIARRWRALFHSIFLLLVLSWAAVSQAATFYVDSTIDLPDDLRGDGICRSFIANVQVCTLRGAIQEANANPFPRHDCFVGRCL